MFVVETVFLVVWDELVTTEVVLVVAYSVEFEVTIDVVFNAPLDFSPKFLACEPCRIHIAPKRRNNIIIENSKTDSLGGLNKCLKFRTCSLNLHNKFIDKS